MNKIYIKASLAALVSLSAVSCQEDRSDLRVAESSSSLVSIIPTVSTVRTVEYVTKGELINRPGPEDTPDNIDFPEDRTFFVTSWDATGTSAFIPAWTEVRYLNGELGETGLYRDMWKPTDVSGKIVEYNWKPGVEKSFYAYANLGDCGEASVTTDTGTGCASGMSVEYTVPESAAAQSDLLLGYYSGIGDGEVPGKTNGTANIVFNHALTSVVVKLGKVTGTATFSVTGLGLEGVCASGTCVMTPASAVEEQPEDRVEWTPAKMDGEPVTTDVSQTVTSTPEPTDEDPTPAIGEPFIVIPQTFASESKARLKVSIEVDGRPVDIYYPLKGCGWGAGKVNIYTVDYNGHEGIQLWEDGPYWATKNVGAESPEDYGWYFSWANPTAYEIRNVSDTPVQSGSSNYACECYTVIGGIKNEHPFQGDPYMAEYANSYNQHVEVGVTHDGAQANKGVKWRLPSKEECAGLIANTEMSYTTRNNVWGFLFTGTQTGYKNRSIFIPASGWSTAGTVSHRATAAYLWTSTFKDVGSTCVTGYSLQIGYNANGSSPSLKENREFIGVLGDLGYGGRVIRAVENTEYKED